MNSLYIARCFKQYHYANVEFSALGRTTPHDVENYFYSEKYIELAIEAQKYLQRIGVDSDLIL